MINYYYSFVASDGELNPELIKIDDDTFPDTEKIISKINKNKNRYIIEAVEFYNMLHKRKILYKQFEKESLLVRNESI